MMISMCDLPLVRWPTGKCVRHVSALLIKDSASCQSCGLGRWSDILAAASETSCRILAEAIWQDPTFSFCFDMGQKCPDRPKILRASKRLDMRSSEVRYCTLSMFIQAVGTTHSTTTKDSAHRAASTTWRVHPAKMHVDLVRPFGRGRDVGICRSIVGHEAFVSRNMARQFYRRMVYFENENSRKLDVLEPQIHRWIVPFSQIASMFRGVGAGGTNWVLLQARLVSPVLPVATSLPWRRRVIIGGLCRIAKTPIWCEFLAIMDIDVKSWMNSQIYDSLWSSFGGIWFSGGLHARILRVCVCLKVSNSKNPFPYSVHFPLNVPFKQSMDFSSGNFSDGSRNFRYK